MLGRRLALRSVAHANSIRPTKGCPQQFLFLRLAVALTGNAVVGQGPAATMSASSSTSASAAGALYRHDGVRILHDPYAPNMLEKYGAPGETDGEGFDPYADSVGAGIYSGTVERREHDGSVVIGKQYQNHNPRPGPVYSGGGYTPVSKAIAIYRSEIDSGVPASDTALGKLLDTHPDLVNDVGTG